jgi:hypothetical protein
MKLKAPIFLATPRSRSTALLTLSAPYLEAVQGLHVLGHQTEFFKEYSHRYFTRDVHMMRDNRMEYFPLNRENSPISHHFVYPPIYADKLQRDGHKIQVLAHEKKSNREYLIKIMTSDIRIDWDKDYNWDKSIVDFFNDRKFVITRRKDIKGLAFSLLVSVHTDLWHKRQANENRYKALEENPITINPELCTVIIPDLKGAAMMDKFEEYIQRSGYEHHTFYYEDLTTLQDMKEALNQVFDGNVWQDFLSDAYVEQVMPQNLQLDYKKIIKNYDQIEKIVEQAIENIFG